MVSSGSDTTRRLPAEGGENRKLAPLECMKPIIHITVPGSPDDPRDDLPQLDGVEIHRCPPLHPDDVTVHKGLPVTSPARTLVDAAEFSTREELRAIFRRAREIGLLDLDAVRASRSRVEWRPSLGMLDEVIAEFEDDARRNTGRGE